MKICEFLDPQANEHLRTRLAIGAKQLDSVGVKDVLRQQTPLYSTQYGRTHAYLGMLKTIEPPPQKEKEILYGPQHKAVNDTIAGHVMRYDTVPTRGHKTISASRLIETENNKQKGLYSIVSDGII